MSRNEIYDVSAELERSSEQKVLPRESDPFVSRAEALCPALSERSAFFGMGRERAF